MSNSISHLDLISASQAQKEVTANCLLDAASLAMVFARRASTSSGLNFGLYGGNKKVAGVLTQISNQVVVLTASTVNYILETAGVASVVTTIPGGWPSTLTGGAIALYEVTTGTATVSSYIDWRVGGGITSGTVTSVAVTAPAAGITSTGGPITSSGAITLALANDLAAVEGLTTTGIIRRTAADTWSAGTLVNLTTEVTGVLPVANFSTGSPTGAKFVRDDGVLAIPAGTFASPLTTKGDLLAFSTLNTRLPVGTNGQVLTSDSTASTGMAWAAGILPGVVNSFTKNQSVVPITLTDGATISVDASLSNNFDITLGGDRVLANPTNLTSGMVLNFNITQDATGTRVLTYGTMYKFPAGVVPILSTGANSKDFMSCYYDGSILKCNASKGYA